MKSKEKSRDREEKVRDKKRTRDVTLKTRLGGFDVGQRREIQVVEASIQANSSVNVLCTC